MTLSSPRTYEKKGVKVYIKCFIFTMFIYRGRGRGRVCMRMIGRKVYILVRLISVMFGWLVRKRLKKELEASKKRSAVEKVADNYLEDALKEHTQTMSLARRMQKANLLKAQSQELISAVAGEECPHGVPENEECEICDKEPEDEVDSMFKGIIRRVIGGGSPSPASQASEFGVPTAPAPSGMSPFKQQLIDSIMNSSDEQIKKFLDK